MTKGQNGTLSSPQDIQDKIKQIRDALNWTNNQLAEVLYIELNDDDDCNKIKKFAESIKKQLMRETTDRALLDNYLEILLRHPEVGKLGLVANKYIPIECLDNALRAELHCISREMDKVLSRRLPDNYE